MSKQTIEIRGIKMEMDVDEVARRVETYRVGQSVKVLKKQYSDYKVFPGVIVGFVPFEKLPTIQVMIVDPDRWASDPISIVNINAKSDEDNEIAPLTQFEITFEREDILKKLDNSILEAENKAQDLRQKKEYFVSMFGQFFHPTRAIA